jgi:hypothetical protein
MHITTTSEATLGQVKEDHAICGPNWAAVFDRAAPSPDVGGRRVHDVPCLVRQLADNLATTLVQHADILLTDTVANAVDATAKAHETSRDLNNPDRPSSTVAVARYCRGTVGYIVLADSPIFFRRRSAYDRVELVADNRSDNPLTHTPESIRRSIILARASWQTNRRRLKRHDDTTLVGAGTGDPK